LAGERPYIVYASTWDPASGGQRCLWQLCHELNELGLHAYLPEAALAPGPWHRPEMNLRVLPERKRQYWLGKGAWAIYSDVVPGNPWQAENVIRWALAPPGWMKNQNGTSWLPGQVPGERVYVYQPIFEKYLPGAGTLFLADTESWFHARDLPPKRGGCLYYRKWKDPLPYAVRLLPRISLRRFPGAYHRRDLANYLRQREYLLCCDYLSFIMWEAGLCGTYTVLPPNSAYTKAEYERSLYGGLVGVAYGTDPAEIERARDEVMPDEKGENAVSRRYETVRAYARKTLERFVEETQ